MWPPSRSKYLYIVISRSSMIEVMRTLNISLCTVIEVLHFRQAQIYLFLIVFVFIKGNAVVCWRAGLDSVQPTSRWPPYQVSLLVKYWLKDLRVNCKVTKVGTKSTILRILSYLQLPTPFASIVRLENILVLLILFGECKSGERSKEVHVHIR